MFGNEIFSENMSWDDLFFRSEGLEKKLEVLYEKNLSLFEHLFLSTWIIMSSLFLMSWILWKCILCILRALFIVLGCLLAWLERTFMGKARNVGYGFWLWKKMIHKAQRVFQGFKDWGSLSTIWLLTLFIFSFAALLWFGASSFFIVLLGHTRFILDVTFSSDLSMPPSIWNS